ncbi:MAG: hypothetical protein SH847_14920 [Roseiflexaceae bacterium]|nr:hypothetical protein [Roseiflexaceae bacterium]
MINVQIPQAVGSQRPHAQLWHPSSRTFWFLLALQGLFMAAILLFVLNRLPASMPLADTNGPQHVRDFVLAGNPGADPLIEVGPGVIDRSSSLRGLRVQNQTYYYYFEGRQNHDPLSRGVVTPNQVELLLRDAEGETPLVIYRIVDK